MNPCDCFKPPEFRVRTDTEVNGSCNCCRDIRCESECGCCCFPFFRRRRRDCQEKDEQIQGLYDEMVKRQKEEELKREDTSLAAQGRSVTIGGIERERKESSPEARTEDKRASHRKKTKRKKAEKKEVLLREEQRSGRHARHRLPKDSR